MVSDQRLAILLWRQQLQVDLPVLRLRVVTKIKNSQLGRPLTRLQIGWKMAGFARKLPRKLNT